jgi:hypothetical protein
MSMMMEKELPSKSSSGWLSSSKLGSKKAGKEVLKGIVLKIGGGVVM